MANFRSAILKVLLTEGGYVNDKDDAGGETYKGIARKFWPQWSGWVIIDLAKKQAGYESALNRNMQLNDAVIAFYKLNFWDKVGGDFIDDQEIGNNLVDSAVNEGIKYAVKRAQSIVGLSQTGVVTPELVSKLNSMI